MKSETAFLQDIVRRAESAPAIHVDTSEVVSAARRRRRATRSVAGVSAMALIAVVAATVTGMPAWRWESPPASAPVWAEPAWLADEIALRAAVREELQSCMDGKGWDVTMDEWGGAAEPFDRGAALATFGADRDDCLVTVADAVPGATAVPPVSAYERDLVTRECVEARGYDLRVAPSEVEYRGGAVVDPYEDPALSGISKAEGAELRAACPERWTFPVPSR